MPCDLVGNLPEQVFLVRLIFDASKFQIWGLLGCQAVDISKLNRAIAPGLLSTPFRVQNLFAWHTAPPCRV
jgi:hypothetical protein